jgi:hypothetical protein
VQEVFKELEKAGIRTELVQLAGKKMQGALPAGSAGKRRTGAVLSMIMATSA